MDIDNFLETVEFKNDFVTGSLVVVTKDGSNFACKAPDSNLYIKKINYRNDSMEYRLHGEYRSFNFAAALIPDKQELHIVIDLKDSPEGITLQRLVNEESDFHRIVIEGFAKIKVIDLYEKVKEEIDKSLENKTLTKLNN